MFKVNNISEVRDVDAIYFIKTATDTEFSIVVTDAFGAIVNLKDLQTPAGIQGIASDDGTIEVTGGNFKNIRLSATLVNAINSALKPGDNISELVNDAGYLTSFTEVDPIFQASEASNFVSGDKANLDNQSGVNTGDETSTSIQAKRPLKTIDNKSLEGTGNIEIDYNTVINKPTEFPPSTHTHTISEVINLQNELNSKENISNKVNTISGNSSTEYPTEKAVVDYVSSQIGADFAKVVYFDNVTPNVASIFDLNNPPLVNNPSLKEDVANLYIGTDASTWVYVTSPAGYVTKTVTSSGSNFYITGTSTDAGSIKTGSITKKGQIVIDSEINNDSGLTLKKLPQTTTNISVITRSTSPANLYYLYSKTPTMLWGIDTNSGQIYKMTNRSYTPTLVSTQGGCRSMTINTDGFIYLTRDRQSPGGRITKLDVNGVFQEDILFNFTNNDTFGERGLYIANDNSGNLYVSGFYDNTGGGQYRNFLIKLTTTGTVLHIFREDTTTTSISNTVLIKSKTEDVIYSYDATSTTIQKITPSTNAIADFITLPSTGYSIGTGYNGEIWTVKGTLLTVYNNIGTVIKTTDFVGISQNATQTIIPSYDGFALMNRVTTTLLYELVDVQTVQHKILKTDSLGKVVEATNLQDVEYAPIVHTHTVSQITDFPTFKTIEGQSVIGAGNIDLDKNSVGLGNVDNTSDFEKNTATVVLKNKTIDGGTY